MTVVVDCATLPRLLLLASVLAGSAGCSSLVQRPASPARTESEQRVPEEVFLGVRVLKTEGAGTLDWSVELPANCGGCRLEINRFTSGQNPKDFYFHFLAPSTASMVGTIEGVRVKVDPAKVRGVLVGREQVPFEKTVDGIRFDALRNGPTLTELTGYHALPADAAGDVTEVYTYLETPGVETRIEHADIQRRNGPYASDPWPALERQAALNLEFAAREAIVTLRLDRTVRERGLGTILLMGFDTNYPTQGPEDAHADDPPHWHMHMFWSQDPMIREIGHFYIGSDGLLKKNVVGNMVTHKDARFERGETHMTLTAAGETLYTHTVTPEGYFTLGTPKGSCRFTPVAGGFQTGVDLACDNSLRHRCFRSEDNLAQGRLRLYVDDRLVEEHVYDPDNGVLKRSEVTYEDR